ncbi:hypothetical protein Tco_0664657, partial [Tanacetum coccineum]
ANNDCPKAKMKKVFVGGAWSDNKDGDQMEKDATCLMAIGSQKFKFLGVNVDGIRSLGYFIVLWVTGVLRREFSFVFFDCLDKQCMVLVSLVSRDGKSRGGYCCEHWTSDGCGTWGWGGGAMWEGVDLCTNKVRGGDRVGGRESFIQEEGGGRLELRRSIMVVAGAGLWVVGKREDRDWSICEDTI